MHKFVGAQRFSCGGSTISRKDYSNIKKDEY